ncbi:MAG: high-potential iron-sulfur protein [Bdellovibrionota bacterium]
MSRRYFLQQLCANTGIFAALSALSACSPSNKKTSTSESIPNSLPLDHPLVSTLHFSMDADSVSPEWRKDRGSIPGKGQYCNNCQFYALSGQGNYGQCSLFQNYNVPGNAWCSSWAPKIS